MKKESFVAAIYVITAAFFIFIFSYNLESPTGNLITLQSITPGSSNLVPVLCSSTSWTACQKAFADDINKATVTVGTGITKYVRYNFSFSPGSQPKQNSRILNISIIPQISASNNQARVSMRVSRDGGKTFSPKVHILFPEIQFGERTFNVDVSNDFDQIINNQLIEKPWYTENLTKLVVELGCYKFGTGNNPTCRLDYVSASVKFTDFSFSASLNTSSITVEQGKSASALATITLTGGLPTNTMLEFSSCPASASCSFSPALGKANFTSSFTVAASPLTPLGTYTTKLIRTNPAYLYSDPRSGAISLNIVIVPSSNARITDTCSPTDTLFRVSGQTGGNASQFDDQNYAFKLCFPEVGPISRSCTLPQNPNQEYELFLINKTDNKIYVPGSMSYQYSNQDFTQVCSSNVACYYDTSCQQGYTCLFSLSSTNNGLVGECNTYPTKACCATRDFYPADPCSTFALNDQCGTSVCNQDLDLDNAFAFQPGNAMDNSLSPQSGSAYGCDLFPNDGCSINAMADNCRPGCGPDANSNGIADICEPPAPPQQPCQILSAAWSSSQATEGQQVNLVVTTTAGCNGQNALFLVQEVDALSNDNVNTNPLSVQVLNGQATGTWTAEYQNDGVGDPEYQYQVTIGALSTTSASQLTVSRPVTNVCGNNKLESGETCQTCIQDAGCATGTVCCLSGSTYSCLTSCATGSIVNPGCSPGLVNNNGICVCDEKDDNICPSDLSCFESDPDCDDGDSEVTEDDNCPAVYNEDQEDFDQDATPLDKCFFTQDAYYITSDSSDFICGGDACDLDADNDGICDSDGPIEPYCIGQDQCLYSPLGSIVDLDPGSNQGCSAEEVTCKIEWDCSNVAWYPCDSSTGLRTRDLGDCSKLGIENGLCKCNKYPIYNSECVTESFYMPKTMEKCEAGQQRQQEFPFFDNLSLIITLLLLIGFYLVRKKLNKNL